MKEKIAEAMGKVSDKYINEAVRYNPKKRFMYAGFSGLAALAACALLIFGITALDNNKPETPVAPATPVDSVVCIDINPSIELNVSKSNKIISAVALNEDASVVLKDMNLEDVELKTALNAIIGSLLKNGYLDEAYNAVNVCVENDDEDRANELGDEVAGEISSIFNQQDLIGDVLTETTDVDPEVKALADVYGISVGKLLLAQKVAANMSMELEVVVRFTIVELWDLKDAEPTKLILRDEALLIAVEDAGADINEITMLCNKIQVSDGVFIYLIKFVANGNEKYTYQIDATNGDIIKQEYEYGVEVEIPDIDIDIDGDGDTEEPSEGTTEDATEDTTEDATEGTTEDEYTPVVPTKPITKKEALAYACADAGVDENEVKLDEIKHYPKENQYVIKFTVGMFDYEYLICGSDGSVLDKEIIDKTKEETDEDVEPLTVEEALELALNKAGVTLADVTKYDIKYTTTNASSSYKIHFHVDKEHFEYNVDAMTGEITEKEHPTPVGPGAKPGPAEKPAGPGAKPEPPKPHEKPEPPKPHEKVEAEKPAGPAAKKEAGLKPHEKEALKKAEEAVEGTKLIVTVSK